VACPMAPEGARLAKRSSWAWVRAGVEGQGQGRGPFLGQRCQQLLVGPTDQPLGMVGEDQGAQGAADQHQGQEQQHQGHPEGAGTVQQAASRQ
jgi:hypothetical protein